MQFLDLVRDTQFAFGIPELPPNVVQTHIDQVDEDFKKKDAEAQRNAKFCYQEDDLKTKVEKEKKKREEDAARAEKHDEMFMEAGSSTDANATGGRDSMEDEEEIEDVLENGIEDDFEGDLDRDVTANLGDAIFNAGYTPALLP